MRVHNLLTQSTERIIYEQQKRNDFNMSEINKNILLEDKKGELVSKAKSGANYSDQSKGKNRYERRTKSKLASSVKHFNSIDMDKLFKADILDVNIDVSGETNDYVVRISFSGIFDELHNFMGRIKGSDISRKIISQALSRAYNNTDVYYNCTCPDFRYRHSYNATKAGNLIGDPETRPIRKDVYHAGGLEAANYYGDRGPACKHIILALKDTSWLIRVGSVIYNYINYMKDHREREYQKYIYPAIYQEPYPDVEVQLDITDIEPEITTTEDNIDISEYQEIVDDDLANNNGRLSTTTRELIDDAGLSLVKNTDGSFTVRGNRLKGSSPIQKRTAMTNGKRNTQINRSNEIDTANKLAVNRGRFQPGNEYRFKKNPNNTTDDQQRINFDELEKELL